MKFWEVFGFSWAKIVAAIAKNVNLENQEKHNMNLSLPGKIGLNIFLYCEQTTGCTENLNIVLESFLEVLLGGK